AIRQHAGYLAKRNWDGVSASLSVFMGNAHDLLGLLHQAESDVELAIELIQNVRPDDVARRFQAEVQRRLHNYVASVKSLVDHTRRLMDGYEGHDVRVEYERRKDELVAQPVAAFFNGLRNY